MLLGFRRLLPAVGAVAALLVLGVQPALAAPAGRIIATHSFSDIVVAVAVDSGYNQTYVVRAVGWPASQTVLQVINGNDQTIRTGPGSSLTLPGTPHEGGVTVDSVSHRIFVGTGKRVQRITPSADPASPFAGPGFSVVATGDLTGGQDHARRLTFNPYNGHVYAVVNDIPGGNVGFRFLPGGFGAGATGTLVSYPNPTELAVDAATGLVFAGSSYASPSPANGNLQLIRVYSGTTQKGATYPTGLVSAWRLTVARIGSTSAVYYMEDPYCFVEANPYCNGPRLVRFAYTYSGEVFNAEPAQTVAIGSPPAAVGYNPTSSRVYATMPSGGDVSVVDALNAPLVELDSVSLASAPGPQYSPGASSEFAVNPVTNRVYFVTGYSTGGGAAVKVLAECNPVDDPPALVPCP
jgi:hypothetical protein